MRLAFLIVTSAFLCSQADTGFSQTKDSNEEGGTEEVASDSDSMALDQHGLGFGINTFDPIGISIFYDYNLHSTSRQIHFQWDSGSEERRALLGDSGAELTKSNLSVSGRHVFKKGWYVGAGVGFYSSSLMVTQDSKKTTFNSSGALGLLEAGWQGDKYYYFHVGFRQAIILSKSEKFDIEKVDDVSNHRAVTNELWEKRHEYSVLIFGFGWYIEP